LAEIGKLALPVLRFDLARTRVNIATGTAPVVGSPPGRDPAAEGGREG
jgi:hypothetical protein